MSKRALIFPGQGSQFVGMTEDFNESAQATLKEMNALLNIDLLSMMHHDERINETTYTQPAILMHSIALLEQYNGKFDYCLGHSLGEFSALVAAGVLTKEAAVQIVYKRGQLMNEAYPNGIGKMAAIMGTKREVIEEACTAISNHEQVLNIANINGPGQIVVSGHSEAIDALVEQKQTLGLKKVIPLNVSGPFHSELMKVIESDFESFINQFEFSDAKVPVIQNVTATPVTNAVEIKANLIKQLYSPVEFTNSIQYLIDNGVTEFVEVGPKNVLTSLVKKINRDVNTINIATTNDLSEV